MQIKETYLSTFFGLIIGFGISTFSSYQANKHVEDMKRMEVVMAQVQKCTDSELMQEQIINSAPKSIQKIIKKKPTQNL